MANWKLIGLAGVGGVAAAGVLLSRRRRDWTEPSPEELRDKLHDRLAASTASTEGAEGAVSTAAAAAEADERSGPADGDGDGG
ncbi:MAG: hypothetical protein AAF962_23075 [Actinomycetota bacterium]